MNIFALLLGLIALILFAIATFPVPAKFNLVAAGLFFLTASFGVQELARHHHVHF